MSAWETEVAHLYSCYKVEDHKSVVNALLKAESVNFLSGFIGMALIQYHYDQLFVHRILNLCKVTVNPTIRELYE